MWVVGSVGYVGSGVCWLCGWCVLLVVLVVCTVGRVGGVYVLLWSLLKHTVQGVRVFKLLRGDNL